MCEQIQEELVTVVIPVYNVEDYLNRCVDSVIRQSHRNLEIILVDDGSTDNSGRMCDNLEDKDSRIRVIHKSNGGLSDARNVGIETANGSYILFVDSDDYIHREAVEILLRMLINNNADISCCSYKEVYECDPIKDDEVKDCKLSEWDRVEAFRKILLSQDITNSAWAKLYKKSLFDNVRFPVGRIFEDQGTAYKIINGVEKVVFTDSVLWYYFIRNTSIQNSGWSEKCFDEIDLCRETVEFINDNYPQLKVEAINRWLSSCFHILFKYYDSHINDRPYLERIVNLQKEIKKYRIRSIISNKMTMKVRIGCLSSLLGFRVAYRIYCLSNARGKLG